MCYNIICEHTYHENRQKGRKKKFYVLAEQTYKIFPLTKKNVQNVKKTELNKNNFCFEISRERKRERARKECIKYEKSHFKAIQI